MNRLLRLFRLLLFARFRPKVGLLDAIRTPFRVSPTDLDVLRHMHNGVYFSLLDLARMDLIYRTRLNEVFRRRGWFPIVTQESIAFRRSKETVARALVGGRILKLGGGSVPPPEVAEQVGVSESPALPEWAGRVLAGHAELVPQ